MSPTEPTTSLLPVFSRVFWMMLGPMILAILAYAIINNGNGWFTFADFAFLAVLGALLLTRWLEFRGGSPQTSTGEPAAPGDLRHYMISTVLLGGLAWITANLIGNYWLSQ